MVKSLLSTCGTESLYRENIWSETPFHAACTFGQSRDLVSYILDRNSISINIQGKCSILLRSLLDNKHTQLGSWVHYPKRKYSFLLCDLFYMRKLCPKHMLTRKKQNKKIYSNFFKWFFFLRMSHWNNNFQFCFLTFKILKCPIAINITYYLPSWFSK